MYLQMEGIGIVHKSITLPDKTTRHPRQVDVYLEIEAKGHKLGILVDAKFRKDKLDIKDIEEVISLAVAVGANKSVIVASNGWTEPAKIKADAVGLDLRLWTLEQALDFIVPDKWLLCPVCENDCIVLDRSGGMVVDDMWSLLTAGKCRECNSALVLCWACGEHILLEEKQEAKCTCDHKWRNDPGGVFAKPCGSAEWAIIQANKDAKFELGSEESYHSNRGFAHREQGDFELSILELTKAIEIAPQSAIAYYNRAITHDQFGNLDQAILDYTWSIELDPNYAMAYGSRGIAYYASSDFRRAVLDFNHYLELYPDSPDREVILNAIRHAKAKLE